jgi:hypothetical protein
MQIGDVLGEAWGLYKRFFWRFFLTAFVVYAILDLFSALANAAAGDSFLAGLFWGLIAAAAGVVGFFWVQGALVEVVQDVRDGRADRTIGEIYQAVSPRLPSLIVGGILAGIGIAIGLILFIVPGLFLLTIWSMLVAVIVIEGKSAGEAFGRSREIVRGHGWAVFGLIIVTFVLVAVASGVITLLFAPLPEFFDTWLGSLFAHSLTVPFAAAALTTAYFQLTAPAPAAAEPAAAAPPPVA